MLMFMFMSMRMKVLVNCFSVNMHMLVDEVYSEKEGHIIKHLYRLPVSLNSMIFTHDHGSVADLLDYFQVMCSSDHSFSR